MIDSDPDVMFDKYASMHKDNLECQRAGKPLRWERDQLKAIHALACALRDCKREEVI